MMLIPPASLGIERSSASTIVVPAEIAKCASMVARELVQPVADN
jgi:hypothetical protein